MTQKSLVCGDVGMQTAARTWDASVWWRVYHNCTNFCDQTLVALICHCQFPDRPSTTYKSSLQNGKQQRQPN